MSNLDYHLQQSLHKGYISDVSESKLDLLPEFLTNDPVNHRKVLTTLLQELQTCEEFWFSVAFITTSGVASLINTLSELKDRKIKGRIVASKYLNFTQPLALERLMVNFPNIELRIVEHGDFHAKGYLFRKGETYNMIIGSSNLTSAALSKNKEWNLKISAKKESYIMLNALTEFNREFDKASIVTPEWLENYSIVYEQIRTANQKVQSLEQKSLVIKPNSMQMEALDNLKNLRNQNKNKALLISATGTGKTYLSAFDVAAFQAKRCLFVVHRLNIAEAAIKTFKNVLGTDKKYGLYSGNRRDIDADYLFTTIQTISKKEHLECFDPEHFDYIIIDETHRAGADSYTRVIDYFEPKFLLGMTATPERTDGEDIFSLFDHNIAYEIRLHRAMEENMLSEFHYYGVQDLSIDGKLIDDKSDFRYLESQERVNHILKTSESYGTDDGVIRGLVFCSRKQECYALSQAFNERGYNTIALTGDSSEYNRKEAILRLESDEPDRLDYIFTVDIFNEGIDIPRVNQIIMIRPTNSAIIFVQQLGRGLRKVEGKKYVTIIDFIGNYQNNYLVPIALYGDTSYNKDNLRKMISGGSKIIPGASTINFDKVTKDKIYESIDNSNLSLLKDLRRDYQILKYKIGRLPNMMDFVENGNRDPFLYVSSQKSYFNFVAGLEKCYPTIDAETKKIQELFASEINNGIRPEESIVLLELIKSDRVSLTSINNILKSKYDRILDGQTTDSILLNLNFDFVKKQKDIVRFDGTFFTRGQDLQKLLSYDFLIDYIRDNCKYSIHRYDQIFDLEKYDKGFIRFEKYGRKDVCRILNWPFDRSSTIYGYRTVNEQTPCFVTYHKQSDVEDNVDYNDHFIDSSTFAWESRSNRKLTSPEIQNVIDSDFILLFVKKEDKEGKSFYYLGEVEIIDGSIQQSKMPKTGAPVVHFKYHLDTPVEKNLYQYLTKD